jgi:hypothetical protein
MTKKSVYGNDSVCEPMQDEANEQAGCGNVVTFPKPYSRLAALNGVAYSRLPVLNAHRAEAA